MEKSVVETQQQEVKDANDRLKQLEKDQQALEQELQKKCETFELNKERIKDARSIVFLNEARAKATELLGKATEDVTVLPVKNNQNSPENMTPPQAFPFGLPPTSTRVKLKGVELPTFSGEAWNAAFTSVVDDTNMPVKEKMLRLQNCLRGKALETVRDLGYSDYAYEKAKEKLERKYGGKRRQILTHLATLRGLSKVRRYNVEQWKTWKNYWQSSIEYWLHCKMVTKMEN